jgi:hypothetical protein
LAIYAAKKYGIGKRENTVLNSGNNGKIKYNSSEIVLQKFGN